MNIKFNLIFIFVMLVMQGCGGAGDDGDSTINTNTSTIGGVTVIAVTPCTDGVTAFESGDEINKTTTPTTLRMSYGEDGSQIGCVVTGGAELSRDEPAI